MRLVAILLVLFAFPACGSSTSRLEQLQHDAVAALRRGDLAVAQSIAERGLALAGADPISPWTWTFRLVRAESLLLQLRRAEAEADLTEPLPSGAAFDSLRARQKYLVAKADAANGSFKSALAAVEDGLRLPSTSEVGLDLQELAGQIRLRLGQRAAAESLLLETIANADRNADHYHQALAMNDLGMGRLSSNRFDEALAWFERVVALRDLEPLTIYAVSLYNTGICYAELGDYERAVSLQRRAVEIQERRGAQSRLEQALGALGHTYLIQEAPSNALPYLQRAFTLATRIHAGLDAAVLGGNIAETYIVLHQWDAAAHFNDDARKISRANGTGKQVWYTLNDAKIQEGRGRRDEARQRYEETVAASADEPIVQWNANAGLARLAVADHDDKRAAVYFERALQIIEQTQSDLQKTDYKLSYFSRLIEFYREYVDALIAEGRTDRALEIADSSRGRVLAERQRTASPTRVNVATLQNIAQRSGQVMLFYWLQPNTSRLWVITPKETHLVALPPGDQIEALVREYQKMIGSALTDPLAAGDTPGDQLYAALVAPAARWIAPGASLVIVPDGALHGLNFETLPVAAPQRHYWIEDVEIQVAPSLGLLAAENAGAPQRPVPTVSLASSRPQSPPQSPRREPSSLLLIGSPTVTDPKYPALSYASAEMATVAAHFGTGRVVSFEGPRASPAAYRNASPDRFSMIHFTAHAAANLESPLDSAVILSPENGAYKLYARDVADLPLHAELVTVSACRGAGERTYSGEGLIGFAWAFLRAGARRVIAGLWDVDDQSTARLMETLYARIADGGSPSRALREAKLAMLRGGGSFGRPYYWGPFELFTVAP